ARGGDVLRLGHEPRAAPRDDRGSHLARDRGRRAAHEARPQPRRRRDRPPRARARPHPRARRPRRAVRRAPRDGRRPPEERAHGEARRGERLPRAARASDEHAPRGPPRVRARAEPVRHLPAAERFDPRPRVLLFYLTRGSRPSPRRAKPAGAPLPRSLRSALASLASLPAVTVSGGIDAAGGSPRSLRSALASLASLPAVTVSGGIDAACGSPPSLRSALASLAAGRGGAGRSTAGFDDDVGVAEGSVGVDVGGCVGAGPGLESAAGDLVPCRIVDLRGRK